MGTSYDGTYFYGLLYDNDEDGWPEEAAAILDGDDFDGWLDEFLRVPKWDSGVPYDERKAIREARCLDRFGVTGFECSYIGNLEYCAWYVAPKGARLREWRGAAVPEWPADDVETWRVACEKLAAVLPGAKGPGLYFGCSVG
jgi:hypothetical protein